MNRKSSKKNHWEDHYTRKARKDKYPARSVYKLEEIQKKFRVIKKGDRVLDLGCAPGSWLLYAAELTGDQGEVVGIDQKPVAIQTPEHVKVFTGDALDELDIVVGMLGKGYNAVISDMAPGTTGNKTVDAARSMGLCEAALNLAGAVLKPGGSFICKVFQSGEVKQFSDEVRKRFAQQKTFKPQSSRKASKEIFIIGLNLKN
ncbi:MAG: RlmE family RNA methyltransferase [Deltaproteobacteria bacterium]|nr:MAG: RlmE family RNA methyltransferase [Deltaproteobacteria bacterium]